MPAPSAAIYTQPILSIYDLGVLGFSNRFVWACPTRLIRDHYNTHVSCRHLDAGVGTGYFVDRCAFPCADPALTLLDLSPHSLARACRRVRRYRPESVLADVTQPLTLPMAPFDSIGANYLLHCLPGPMRDKSVAIGHLAALLRPGGVLFGTTILGRGVARGPLARLFLSVYNAHGIFSNWEDDEAALTDALRTHFRSVEVRVVGSVAFFVGRA